MLVLLLQYVLKVKLPLAKNSTRRQLLKYYVSLIGDKLKNLLTEYS